MKQTQGQSIDGAIQAQNPKDMIQGQSQAIATSNAFLRGIFTWMALGLAVSAGAAYCTMTIETLTEFAFKYNIYLAIGTLVIVFGLSAFIQRLSPAIASVIFLAYSAVMGIFITPLLLSYTEASVLQAFITASAMFGTMAIFGYVTKKDLSGWGSFLFMGLIGGLIAMLVNMFFVQSNGMSLLISGAMVVVFTGLTAYDVQKWKKRGMMAPDDGAAVHRATIMGALDLYLDFINIFIHLLRLFGERR